MRADHTRLVEGIDVEASRLSALLSPTAMTISRNDLCGMNRSFVLEQRLIHVTDSEVARASAAGHECALCS